MTNLKLSSRELKQQLYVLCLDFVENRRKTIQNTIDEIQEALTSETKSSAGDKHETGRAILQLERENSGHQLAEIEKLQESISKIEITLTSKIVGLGSIVFTTQSNYFIAISAGQFDLGPQSFYAISPNTPIGMLLIGKTIDDVIDFRDNNFKILNVF